MKNQQQLINNIIGQLEGLKKMIDEEKDCFDVLIQMKAARSALSGVMNRFIEENFLECSNLRKKDDREKMEKLLKELTKN